MPEKLTACKECRHEGGLWEDGQRGSCLASPVMRFDSYCGKNEQAWRWADRRYKTVPYGGWIGWLLRLTKEVPHEGDVGRQVLQYAKQSDVNTDGHCRHFEAKDG